MDIKNIIKLLEENFVRMTELFKKDDWKFYKFGLGGPYKRELTVLVKLSKKHDKTLQDHFGLTEDTANFAKLIVLCLAAVENPKEMYNNIDTFKRQIRRMKKIL